jgi:hypothetical protein
MDSNNSLVVEMRLLNELRKLKPEERKELLETLERQEKLEEETLKKNPNLHVENKLSQVLNELKDLRTDMQIIKNSCNQCPVINGNSNCQGELKLCLSTEDESSSGCLDSCSSFSIIRNIDWWSVIFTVLLFVSLLHLPNSKSRPCPITV